MASAHRRVVSLTDKAVEEAAIAKLQAGLRGRLIRPGDFDYENARHIWNLAFDKHPARIVRCGDAPDVPRSVEFAVTNDVRTAVRGGGHSFSGKSTCDGGMVLTSPA